MADSSSNPYSHEKDSTVYEIGHRQAWIFSVAFMLLLGLPALSEHLIKTVAGQWSSTPAGKLFSWTPAQEPLMDRLHSVEKSMDEAWYAKSLRQNTQALLTQWAVEGNRKSFIGFKGWLFYQPDLKAITGYGPLKPEPFSVMKDPGLGKLRDTKDVIVEFSAQLKERGISLLLVPVPLKPMIYGEFVSSKATDAYVTHPDAGAFYNELRGSGVDVLDLTADMAKFREKRKHTFIREFSPKEKSLLNAAQAALKEDPLRKLPDEYQAVIDEDNQSREKQAAYLKQDTHWTPEAMRFSAEKIAAYVQKKYPQIEQPTFKEIAAVDGLSSSSLGDLVKLLDLKEPEVQFDYEEAFLKVLGEGTESKFASVALLGDSFVNIYDDPTLGFEREDQPTERLHAGLAQHLSLLLKQPLDVIAMNGKGSTGVRREFAKRYDDEVREKKLVIWVIAARDLLLAKSAARDANIEWSKVEFNPKRNPGAISTAPANDAPLVIEAKLTEKSKNQELNGTPYANALHTAVYEVENVVSGKLDSKQVLAIQWTFKEKQPQPTASFALGQRYRLTLVPWDKKTDLKTINLQDDSTLFDADRWFVEKAEPLK